MTDDDDRFHNVELMLARIETKLDSVVSRQDDHERRMRTIEQTGCPLGASARGKQESLEKRVADLERWRFAFPSFAAVLAIASLTITILTALP